MSRRLSSLLGGTLIATSLFAASSVDALQIPPTERALKDAAEGYWDMAKRGIIDSSAVATNYDFIICGGGLAGLVMASRLSEDQNKTVLVIEAGDTGYAVQQSISVPGNAYYSSLLGSDYDWQYKTQPQTNLQNRTLDWPRGRVLGGSTAVNGLYLVRPSTLEVNAWTTLAGDTNNTYWGWDNFFESMKKSETFTPPSAAIATQAGIQYIADNHGYDGPVDYSYPGYILPIVGEWTQVLEGIGIVTSPDPNGGQGWGGFIATSSINPTNWTRSYSRSAYIDPLPPRSNLAILPNARVLKIETKTAANGSVSATGVTYATSPTGPSITVTANKEVILTAGAIGSPQLLMLSGIGNKAELATLNITSVVDLPGVGQHVQDHLSGQVIFKTTAMTAASEVTNATLTNGSETFLSFVNSAIAYANITDLFGDYDTTFTSEVAANLTWAQQNVLPSTDPTVIAGYTATYKVGTDIVLKSRVGQVELLMGLTGTSQGGDDSIAIQAALQHPFSRGRIWLNSASAWEYPLIDPNYLSHPADVFMLREGLKLARKLGQTAPLSTYITTEVSPGTAVSTDAQWDAWLPSLAVTEYHPSCSCSMLPLEQGGVVGPDLRVHGVTNLRVADSSVYPIQFAAHLMAPTYGLAERASDMIKADWGGKAVGHNSTTPTTNTSSPSTSSSSSSSSASAGQSTGSTSSTKSAAASGRVGSDWMILAALGSVLVAGLSLA